MKLIIQRVSKATVTVAETKQISGQIENGLFVLVGFKKGDTKNSAAVLAKKLVRLRAMSDENNKMNKTVADIKGKFLIVSQFTLYANTKDGNRPSFIEAEEPSKAKELYDYFVSKLESGLPLRSSSERRVETGSFGDFMSIDAVLDGPVTIILESS